MFSSSVTILTGAIAQQKFVLVASNTSSTSKQFVLVAPTTSSLIGISTLMIPASSPPAVGTMSTTRKSSNRYVYIKTWNHTCHSRCPSNNYFYLYLLYKAEKPSVCLSVHLNFWQADNSVSSAWIETRFAWNERCVFVDHRVYFYKPTQPTVHQQERVKDKARYSV